MKIKQISVFLENKPGRLSEPCRILAAAGVNILTATLADTQQFGILRLIVKEGEKARAALEKAGCVVNICEVAAVEVDDQPGGLAGVLQVLEQAGINVEYMYAVTGRRKNRAVIIFGFEDANKAVAALKTKKAPIVAARDLFGCAE